MREELCEKVKDIEKIETWGTRYSMDEFLDCMNRRERVKYPCDVYVHDIGLMQTRGDEEATIAYKDGSVARTTAFQAWVEFLINAECKAGKR